MVGHPGRPPRPASPRPGSARPPSWSSATWSPVGRAWPGSRGSRCSASGSSSPGRRTRPTDRPRSWKPSGPRSCSAPTVQILPLDDFGPLDDAIDRLGSFDWLVFTSGNGVRHFLDRLEARGRDLRALGHLKLAAIGPSTAEALARLPPPGRPRPRLVPLRGAGRGPGRPGRRPAGPAGQGRPGPDDPQGRAGAGRPRRAGRRLSERRRRGRSRRTSSARIEAGSVNWITLTSSAIAERLHGLLPEPARARIGREIRLASLSPVTSAAVARLGWPVAAEAEVYTWDGLVGAIVATGSPPRG